MATLTTERPTERGVGEVAGHVAPHAVTVEKEGSAECPEKKASLLLGFDDFAMEFDTQAAESQAILAGLSQYEIVSVSLRSRPR